jgi:hypothetical protein
MSIEPIHVISLGAGVQSSTMALMAAHGEISPMPVAAVFADTQAEPASVYRWLDWLETQLPFPVLRRTKGSLAEASTLVRISRNGNAYTNATPPAFMDVGKKKEGILMRQCTQEFKIRVIERGVRELRDRVGKGKLAPPVIQWIGISTDEAHRMKPAAKKYIENRWPLIDLEMSRTDCLEWMAKKGYPAPPRSSCTFCPYHSDDEWIRLKMEEPEAFEQAVAYERSFQHALSRTRASGTPYLHRSLVPIDRVEFVPGKGEKQFGNECTGMCGQ